MNNQPSSRASGNIIPAQTDSRFQNFESGHEGPRDNFEVGITFLRTYFAAFDISEEKFNSWARFKKINRENIQDFWEERAYYLNELIIYDMRMENDLPVRRDDFFGKHANVCVKVTQRMTEFYKKVSGEIHLILQKMDIKFTLNLDFLFDMAVSLYRVITYRSRADLIINLIALCKTFFKTSLAGIVDTLVDLVNNFVSEIKKFLNVKYAVPEADFAVKDIYKSLISSELSLSIQKFLINLVGLRFFSKDTTDKFVRALGKPKDVTFLTFIETLINLVDNFMCFGVNVMEGHNLFDSILSGDKVHKFMEQSTLTLRICEKVRVSSDINYSLIMKRMNIPGSTADSVSASAALEMLKHQIDRCDDLLHVVRKDRKLTLSLRHLELKSRFSEIQCKMYGMRRPTPLAIVVHGLPGVGKSSIVTNIYKMLAKYYGLEYSSTMVYNRVISSEYWDGYDPLSHPFVHYSEMGSTHANIAKHKGDPSIQEILSICDSLPYMVNMAAVEDKGKNYAMPKAVVIDCNNTDWNLDVIMNNAAALRRRIVYLKVEVKPEYSLNGSLDKIKVENKPDPQGYWNFTITREEPTSAKESVTRYIARDVPTLKALTKQMFEIIDKHEIEEYRAFKHSQSNGDEIFEDVIEFKSNSNIVFESLVIKDAPMFDLAFLGTVLFVVAALSMWSNFFFYLFVFALICYFAWRSVNECINSSPFKNKLLVDFAYYYVVKDGGYKDYLRYYYAWVRSAFVDDDLLEQRRLNLFIPSNLRKYGLAFITLFVSLSFIKIALYCYSFFHDVHSESKIMEYVSIPDENVDEAVRKVEEKVSIDFPKAKKKSDTDNTYGDNNWGDLTRPAVNTVFSAKTLNLPKEVANTILSNKRWFRALRDGHIVSFVGIGIKGNCAVVNTHSILGATDVTVSSQPYESNVRKIKMENTKCLDMGNDVSMLIITGEYFKDITDYIFDGKRPNYSFDGFFKDTSVRISSHNGCVSTNMEGKVSLLWNVFQYQYKGHTAGDCGTPLVGTIGSSTFLLGIHAAGDKLNDDSYSVPLRRSEIIDCYDRVTEGVFKVNSEGLLRLSQESKLVEVSEKFPARFEDVPGMVILGRDSSKGFVSPKTQLLKSPLIHLVSAFVGVDIYEGGHLKYLPPMMRSCRKDGEYISPYNIWMRKVGVCKKQLNLLRSNKVAHFLTRHLISELKSKGVTKLSPLPYKVALNGYPDNFYMRSMNFSTSAGTLLQGKKRAYNHPAPEEWKSDAVDTDFDIKRQVLSILTAYDKEELSHDIVGAQLKDEPRSYDKAISGKTRVFAMSSYHMTIANRMFLMPFYSLMCEHRDIFCTKVGIDMQSKEADTLYKSLSNFSPLMMEGDYGGYDTSMPVSIGEITNQVVLGVLEELGYNSDALRYVRGILNDNLYPTISLDGNVFVVPGFQPSGKYATAEDNSLRNLVLLMYAFDEMSEGSEFTLEDFFKLILPVTYGDDIVASVKSGAARFFNNVTYSKYVSDVYGMEYTDSSKNSVVKPFTIVDDVSFLKRKFRFNCVLNRMVAVLDKESMVKSLMYVLPSKEISVSQQVFETYLSMLRELFFYCDNESMFNNYRNIMIEHMKELKFLEFDFANIPEFDTLVKQYQ